MVLDRRSLEVEYCNKVHTGLTKKENLPLHGKESSSSEENLRGSPMHLSSSGNGCLAAFIDRNLIFQKRRLTKRGLDIPGHSEGEGCSLGSLLIDATIVGSGSASGGGSQGGVFLMSVQPALLTSNPTSLAISGKKGTRSEEPRIAKEVESNHKRIKKEIGKQDVLRRKADLGHIGFTHILFLFVHLCLSVALKLLSSYGVSNCKTWGNRFLLDTLHGTHASLLQKDDEAGKSSNEVVTKEMADEIAKEKVCLCICVERPREVGAEWMSENIPPDEKIENG
ncbi:hypothetical protein Tco_0983365 [Tanacetum coccineum]